MHLDCACPAIMGIYGCGTRVCAAYRNFTKAEREVMLQEMSPFRDQLLEALDGKIAVDEGLVPQVSLADLAILD